MATLTAPHTETSPVARPVESPHPQVEPPVTVPPAVELTEGEIAVRAFELYCERGYRDGHDLDDWLDAEQELRMQRRHQMMES